MKTLTAKELEEKYYSTPNKKLLKDLKISLPTLLKLLDENGIKQKGKKTKVIKRKLVIIK